jgi:phage baseplate assembly protein W
MGIDRQTIAYSFKASGETQEVYNERTQTNPVPSRAYGIATPMELDTTSGFLKTHKRFFDQVSDNLRNLLITNHGERVGNYYFGANLTPLLFEMGSEDGDRKAMGNISGAISKYMPFVTPVEMVILPIGVPDNDNTGVKRVAVHLKFTVPSVSANTKTIQIVLAMGA